MADNKHKLHGGDRQEAYMLQGHERNVGLLGAGQWHAQSKMKLTEDELAARAARSWMGHVRNERSKKLIQQPDQSE